MLGHMSDIGFYTLFKNIWTSSGFFMILVMNSLRIFPILRSSGFAFSNSSLFLEFSWLYPLKSCSQLFTMALCPPVLLVLAANSYPYSLITYRQYTDNRTDHSREIIFFFLFLCLHLLAFQMAFLHLKLHDLVQLMGKT